MPRRVTQPASGSWARPSVPSSAATARASPDKNRPVDGSCLASGASSREHAACKAKPQQWPVPLRGSATRPAWSGAARSGVQRAHPTGDEGRGRFRRLHQAPARGGERPTAGSRGSVRRAGRGLRPGWLLDDTSLPKPRSHAWGWRALAPRAGPPPRDRLLGATVGDGLGVPGRGTAQINARHLARGRADGARIAGGQMRWRIEHHSQDLERNPGPGDQEARDWRRLRRHAAEAASAMRAEHGATHVHAERRTGAAWRPPAIAQGWFAA